MMKSAFIAVAGRPSAGKSTLINTLCGHKVSIVTPVPQTTRNRIRGIYTDERGQLVFLDTPGYYESEKKFNKYMHNVLSRAVNDADILLYMIDLSRRPGEEENLILDLVKDSKKSVITVLSKVDIQPNFAGLAGELLSARALTSPVIEISALEKRNIDRLTDLLFDAAPTGDLLYPSEYYTDQDPEFRISEIIREKAILQTRQEIPHAMYVEIADAKMSEDESELSVRGFLCVERESQKGILIGHRGRVIRTIVKEAEADLAEIFPYRVSLDLRVRVRPKWKGNDHLLGRLVR